MTEDEVLELARALPGVTVTTAGPDDVGTPESAWGDSFVFYDPDDRPADRLWPFATVVCSDYPGFDTVSRLDRPGVYRVNLAVGRRAFEELVGYPPAAPRARRRARPRRAGRPAPAPCLRRAGLGLGALPRRPGGGSAARPARARAPASGGTPQAGLTGWRAGPWVRWRGSPVSPSGPCTTTTASACCGPAAAPR